VRAKALIKELQRLVKEHGNLEVRIRAIRQGRLDDVGIDSVTGRFKGKLDNTLFLIETEDA
jgi:hypothetical protein